MAQIPTSSITMAAIKAETGVAADGTLDQCRAASIGYTMTSTSVPGHTRDGNEQTNTNASPWNNTMAEWAGYTHTQSMGSINYNVRTSSTLAEYGLRVMAEEMYEAFGQIQACGCESAITIWRTHDADNTYIKAKAFHYGAGGNTSNNEALRQYHNGSSATGLGYTSGGTTMITIPVGSDDVTRSVDGNNASTTQTGGAFISMTYSPMQFTSYNYSPTSLWSEATTPDDISGTGATLLICRGAQYALTVPEPPQNINVSLQRAKYKVVLTAQTFATDTGTQYETTVLNAGQSGDGIIVHSENSAESWDYN